MKIIHAADIHFCSRIDYPFQKERKEEIRNSFLRMVEYAEEQKVSAILLSGDIFDSNTPGIKDMEFFISVIKEHSRIQFYYLRGNHDFKNSLSNYEIGNLNLFSDTWRYYEMNDVVIAGIEMNSSNYLSMYSSLNLDKQKTNVVLLHGKISESDSVESIRLSKLKDKNIDYLALGHIHSYQQSHIDDRGMYCYSGCLEPRGFDETGKKGFVLLEILDGKINSSFVPFAVREFHKVTLDVSDCDSYLSLLNQVKKEVPLDKKDMYQITFTGETAFEIQDVMLRIQEYFRDQACYLEFIDSTLPKIDCRKYENEFSVKGEFVRTVLAEESLSEAEKNEILSCGLKALEGRDIE